MNRSPSWAINLGPLQSIWVTGRGKKLGYSYRPYNVKDDAPWECAMRMER
jgi:hypothetical protein